MRNYLFTAAVIVAQALVAISPLLPGLQRIWGANVAPVDVLSINFAVLAVTLPLILLVELHSHRQLLSTLDGDGTEVRWVKAAEFYSQFASEIGAAKDYVDIAYLAAYPPAETADEPRRRYYQDLPLTMKRRPEIMFRRLVRDSKKNRPWIREILKAMKGSRNFELAIVADNEAEEQSLALSVQVIDGDRAWLVAVRSHEPRGGPRDLFVRGKTIGDGLRSYYERVWMRGVTLMKAGNLTSEGEAYAKDAS